MKVQRFTLFAPLASVVLLATVLAINGKFATAQSNGTTERVSIASDGTQGNQGSYWPSISADGRYVSFSSRASNLIDDDTNDLSDVFVYDRQTNQISRVSVASGGTQENSTCSSSSISGDGRYVAFECWRVSFQLEDPDVFIHDRQTNQTILVSVASDGTPGNDWSRMPALSANGRFVAFESDSTNLVDDDTNNFCYGSHPDGSCADIFVHDRQTGQTTLVSVSSTGVQGDAESLGPPSISADGRYVTFQSSASNLVPNDTNNNPDIFLHDRQTGQTTRISVNSDGTQFNRYSASPAISADGRYVAFLSSGDSVAAGIVFVHDQHTGQTTSIAQWSFGGLGNNYKPHISLSSDGRYVAYESILGGQVFLYDRQTSQTTLMSAALNGSAGNGYSDEPSISADGRYVAFSSDATNLVNDDTNGFSDIFMRDREGVPSDTIAGQVIDVDNNAISGVTISDNAGHTTTTGTDGTYSLSGIVAGTYILTPSKSSGNYTFSPPTRTVTIPPGATEQDFTDVTDSDGDALYDYWETNGRNGLDLPAMGADPNHKDIFVEVDYMEGCTSVFPGVCRIHSHRPNPDAIALVVESFKNAPVGGNPDGLSGINLHVDFGSSWGGELSGSNELPHDDYLSETEYYDLKQDNFDTKREGVFHYAIFAHFLAGDQICVSGINWSGLRDDDFVVSLGGWGENDECDPSRRYATGTLWQQAGIFMHELGHNLGLHHGGGDAINYKPNYLSVMNYAFSTHGLTYDGQEGGVFNYMKSDQVPQLDETNLNEGVGLNGGSSTALYGTIKTCPNADWGVVVRIPTANNAIDWNCNNDDTDVGISVDINGDDLCIGPGDNGILNTTPIGDDIVQVENGIASILNGPNGVCDSVANSDDAQQSLLTGFNDWANLFYRGGAIGTGSNSNSLMVTNTILQSELTFEQDQLLPHPYRVGLTGPQGLVGPQDYTAVYTFTISNIGDNDDLYTLTAQSSLGWADLTSIPSTISLPSRTAREFTVSVTIPSTASRNEVDELRIAAMSTNNPALWTSHYALTSVKASSIYLPLILK